MIALVLTIYLFCVTTYWTGAATTNMLFISIPLVLLAISTVLNLRKGALFFLLLYLFLALPTVPLGSIYNEQVKCLLFGCTVLIPAMALLHILLKNEKKPIRKKTMQISSVNLSQILVIVCILLIICISLIVIAQIQFFSVFLSTVESVGLQILVFTVISIMCSVPFLLDVNYSPTK